MDRGNGVNMDQNFAQQLATALAGALGETTKFKVSSFKGGKDENIESFIDKFDRFCENNNKNEAYKVENFKMHLDGRAYELYDNLSDDKRIGIG